MLLITKNENIYIFIMYLFFLCSNYLSLSVLYVIHITGVPQEYDKTKK